MSFIFTDIFFNLFREYAMLYEFYNTVSVKNKIFLEDFHNLLF